MTVPSDLEAVAAGLAAGVEGRLLAGEPLSRHTTYRVGGPAERLLAAESAGWLVAGWRWAQRRGLPCRVIGGGSNIIVSERGMRGLVIKHRSNQLPVLPTAVEGEELIVSVDAGLVLARLSVWAVRQGWRGLEWAGGIPGTLAGAVIQNAGAHGGQLSDSLLDVTVLLPDGSLAVWPAERLGLGYRHSLWRVATAEPRPLICGLRLRLRRAVVAELQAVVEHGQAYRRLTQPRGCSAGSVFKNPADDYAGRLIDRCGLKGRRLGGVIISPLHANWIINDSQRGTADEIMALAGLARRAVAERFDRQLQLEQEPFGDW